MIDLGKTCPQPLGRREPSAEESRIHSPNRGFSEVADICTALKILIKAFMPTILLLQNVYSRFFPHGQTSFPWQIFLTIHPIKFLLSRSLTPSLLPVLFVYSMPHRSPTFMSYRGSSLPPSSSLNAQHPASWLPSPLNITHVLRSPMFLPRTRPKSSKSFLQTDLWGTCSSLHFSIFSCSRSSMVGGRT